MLTWHFNMLYCYFQIHVLIMNGSVKGLVGPREANWKQYIQALVN